MPLAVSNLSSGFDTNIFKAGTPNSKLANSRVPHILGVSHFSPISCQLSESRQNPSLVIFGDPPGKLVALGSLNPVSIQLGDKQSLF